MRPRRDAQRDLPKGLENTLATFAFTAVAAVLFSLAVREWAIMAWYGDVLPMQFLQFRFTLWALAACTGLAYAVATRRVTAGIGIAFLSLPLWAPVLGFLHSIPELASTTTVLRPRSTYQLSSSYIRGLLWDIGYMGFGFLLWAGVPSSLADWARRLQNAGFRIRWSEHKDALAGFLFFPAVLIGSWIINVVVYAQPALANGDETSIWDNMTPYHAVMISATAAFTEELAYRVLALSVAAWALARLGASRSMALAGAVVLQALLFGIAHSGFGTWAHIIVPLFFGLFAGVVVVYFGVWAAIVFHFLIDIYAFGIHAAGNEPWFWNALWVLLLTNLVASVAWASLFIYRKANKQPVPW